MKKTKERKLKIYVKLKQQRKRKIQVILGKMKIKKVLARQVLDSRGNPTVEAEVFSEHNSARAIVPSGASTGSKEALELRDNDKKIYFGKSVVKAVKNAESLGKKIVGMNSTRQKDIDELMIKLDGTKNKSKFGANAILSISLAVSRLAALETKLPYYKYLSTLSGTKPSWPIPYSNIINGGEHAGNELPMQEFMVVAKNAKSF
ncbi:phosphopyruvate hydratase, partial [Pseudomonadota bacterium]